MAYKRGWVYKHRLEVANKMYPAIPYNAENDAAFYEWHKNSCREVNGWILAK